MKKIVLYFGVTVICCLAGCVNKNPQQTTIETTKFELLDSLTNNWRYKNLDTAFYYSHLAMKEVNKDTVNLGKAYLNYANLYYLCSRFDSAEYYIDQYDSLKIDKPDSLLDAKKINKNLFFKYTYLKMLRDIRKVEIYIRRLDFERSTLLLYDKSLIAFHKYKKYWNDPNLQGNRKKYGNFHNSEKWFWMKMAYNIELAVYNLNLDGTSKDNTENYFDALFQLSRVSDIVIQDTVKRLDKPILFYYNYILANTYVKLADVISNDTIINTYLTDFFEKGDTLNFNFNDEKEILRGYYNDIKNKKKETKVIAEEIAKHYYFNAYKIYSTQLNNLENKKDENIYWIANFKQDLAIFKNKLDRGEIKNDFKMCLIDSFPSLNSINVEKYLLESDSLFEVWSGRYTDFFQFSGSKYLLGDYYYGKGNIELAEKNAEKVKNYNDSAASHKAFCFLDEWKYYDLLNKIDPQKYKPKWLELSSQKKYNYGKTFQNIDYILDTIEKQQENEYKQEHTKRLVFEFTVLTIGLAIVLAIGRAYYRKTRKTYENQEKERIKALQGLTKCYETYIENKKNPELIQYLTEVVAEHIFNIDVAEMELVLAVKNENTGDLEGVFYDKNNEPPINRYIINKDSKRPAMECLKKDEPIFIPDFSKEKSSYYEQQGYGDFAADNINRTKTDDLLHALAFLPIKTNKDKKAHGVISFQLKKEKFTKLEKENCKSLAAFIATSMKDEFDELTSLNTGLETISNINYKNLTEKNYENEIKELFGVIYKLMFGVSSEKAKNDLFTVALWLEEEKKDEDITKIKKDPYLSPKLREESYADEENFILVGYGYERYVKNGNPIDRHDRTVTYLHDYSTRPALYCYAKNKVNAYYNEDMEIMEYYNWKDKNKKEYDEYIDKITKVSKQEKYKNYIKQEYIKPLSNDIFYSSASNDGGLLTNSMLFYPIKAGKEVKGVLSFQHESSSYFIEKHRIILRIIANLIGVAIQKEDARNNFFNVIGSIVTHRCNTYADALGNDAERLNNLKYDDTYFQYIDTKNCMLKNGQAPNVQEFFEDVQAGTFLQNYIFDTFIENESKNRLDRIQIAAKEYQKATYFFDKSKLTKLTEFGLLTCVKEQIKRVNDRMKVKFEGDESKIKKWESITFDYKKIDPALKVHTSKLVIEEILYNLMINTFEHSFGQENKKIDVQIDYTPSPSELILEYSNTGDFIKEDENNNINWIFDFEKSSKEQNGIKGIGLFGIKYLLNNYLEGDITAKNDQENKKVKFIITIKKTRL